MGPILGAFLSNIGSTLFQNQLAKMAQKQANKYNSPEAQIQRLKQAGVSPSTFYGGGGLVTADVQRKTPNVSPDMGYAQGMEQRMRSKALTMQEKIADMQLRDMEMSVKGKEIDNNIKQQELNRYNTDRDLNNYIAMRTETRNQDSFDYYKHIDERRMKNMEMGTALDQAKFAYEQNLQDRRFELQKQGTEFEQKMKTEQYLLDAARLAIQQGHLDISESELAMKWKRYESDTALWTAIDNAFDGKGSVKELSKEILKTGAKEIPNTILKGLQKFFGSKNFKPTFKNKPIPKKK